MDTSSNLDENSDLESRLSSGEQMEGSTANIGCATFSGDLYKIDWASFETSASEIMEENSTSSGFSPFSWTMPKPKAQAALARLGMKHGTHDSDEKLDNQEEIDWEFEIMKERFSKLLLGEDMSGSGKGVCTAVAISNAITNLCATVFGQCYKLEPLSAEKKIIWRIEMTCILSVCDYIVEFIPPGQNIKDGTTLEVMTSRRRSDISINLPALRKLDNMLLEILESFSKTEFWYADDRSLSSNSYTSSTGSFRLRVVKRKEEKWWLPVPCVPPDGLSEKSTKELQNKRECANQILKATMAINSSILAEMEVPESYLQSLPKSGRASLGDSVYRFISTPEHFSPDHLLDSLNISSEHEALDVADHVEASMYVWRRKACIHDSKSSWNMVKDFMADGDRNMTFATRAESLLLFLKQRYPELSQTTLDTSKIENNKDVGQAILESYSRVLESLAFNIVAWIDDVLYVDASVKQPKPLKREEKSSS